MVKTYLRYEQAASFGVIVSGNSNVLWDAAGKLLICAALEKAQVWNVKQGALIHTLAESEGAGAKPEVTALARHNASPSSVESKGLLQSQVAVGYSNGSIRLWNYVKGVDDVVLHGHGSAVTALRHNASGALLASGAKDTDVIVWDVAGEVGLYRFKGHRDQVTDVVFLERGRRLISASRDTFVRVWDLDTQSCIQTLVGHRCEVWSLDLNPAQTRLVTAGSDAQLRFFRVEEGEGGKEVLGSMGSVQRQSGDRAVTVRFEARGGGLLGCQAAGKTVELYKVRDSNEASRRAKRRKKRKKGKGEGEGEAEAEGEGVEEETVSAADEVALLQVLRSKHKIRSFAFSPETGRKGLTAVVALALHSNGLEVYDISEGSAELSRAVDLPGHRSDVRSLALSSDAALLLSTSNHSLKIWNPTTGVCLRTVASGYGLCSLFAPGNAHAVVGTKEGRLEVVDVGAGERVASLAAHEGAVWGIAALPDGSGVATASADKYVKNSKRLSLSERRSLKLTEDVLSVRFSPDGKYLALALLDATVKVFFVDSLKFFLSLYGHKLPVLCVDISSDGVLLASGSADKNLKLWGLDFGDCHKSLFAHADSVMAVQFVRGTHYLFTAGKDGVVKYWDCDKFEQLLALEGHHAAVWAVAVSPLGDFVVSGAHDRSIRRWERTEEPFFVEEEREARLESLFDAEGEEEAPQAEVQGMEATQTASVGRKSKDTLSAADRIIAAVDVAADEVQRREAHQRERSGKPLPPNAFLRDLSPAAYVAAALAAVRSSDLEQALLTLPFPDALQVLEYIQEGMEEGGRVELCARVCVLLLRMHQQQLVSTPAARPLLTALAGRLRGAMEGLRATLGFNLAAMGHLQGMLTRRSNAPYSEAAKQVAAVREKLAKGRDAILAENARVRKKKKQKKAAA